MVADELALSLAAEHVELGSTVLDPFCGSGRLLAAAANASVRIGIDANPLAWLITSAKLASVDAQTIACICDELPKASRHHARGSLELPADRKVRWFSVRVLKELAAIVDWINSLNLKRADRLLVACALSATVREVSYAHQGGWKLHRLNAANRKAFSASPWERLAKRLRYCANEIMQAPPVQGKQYVKISDARQLNYEIWPQPLRKPVDLVITSPPYGDSRTTVQYGAASSLCMSIVSAVMGCESLARFGRDIDRDCLGGNEVEMSVAKKYWAGTANSREGRGVASFLGDYDRVCKAVSNCLKPNGKAIFIVGRRSTGGYRLYLDKFTIDTFEHYGLNLISAQKRNLRYKRVPRIINRYGRSSDAVDKANGLVVTMQDELVLVMKKRDNSCSRACRPRDTAHIK